MNLFITIILSFCFLLELHYIIFRNEITPKITKFALITFFLLSLPYAIYSKNYLLLGINLLFLPICILFFKTERDFEKPHSKYFIGLIINLGLQIIFY